MELTHFNSNPCFNFIEFIHDFATPERPNNIKTSKLFLLNLMQIDY